MTYLVLKYLIQPAAYGVIDDQETLPSGCGTENPGKSQAANRLLKRETTHHSSSFLGRSSRVLCTVSGNQR